jgi:hypothetical protein
MQNNIILIPIYNDWNSLNILLKKIIDLKIFIKKTKVIIVNDFSKEKIYIKKFLLRKKLNIKVINLKKNIGSQRCIAVGLTYIKKNYLSSNIIIMDGDGEDNPLLIKKLLNFSIKKENKIIVVNRTIRTENILIKILYEINFINFFLLTHKFIRFGNFSLLKSTALNKIKNSKDLWLAYPSTIIKNFTNIKMIFAKKEMRYAGQSKMSYFNLFTHVIRILSVLRKKIFFNSFFYIIFLILLYIYTNKILLLILILYLILLNILLFIAQSIFFKEIPSNYLNLINNVKII